jgi:hypothetical protein
MSLRDRSNRTDRRVSKAFDRRRAAEADKIRRSIRSASGRQTKTASARVRVIAQADAVDRNSGESINRRAPTPLPGATREAKQYAGHRGGASPRRGLRSEGRKRTRRHFAKRSAARGRAAAPKRSKGSASNCTWKVLRRTTVVLPPPRSRMILAMSTLRTRRAIRFTQHLSIRKPCSWHSCCFFGSRHGSTSIRRALQYSHLTTSFGQRRPPNSVFRPSPRDAVCFAARPACCAVHPQHCVFRDR